MDTLGRVLSTPIDQVYPQAGTYTVPFNSGGIAVRSLLCQITEWYYSAGENNDEGEIRR
ncbi:MAG: hypothetical protein WKF59_05200 [Chitinophagaceae bacterium]